MEKISTNYTLLSLQLFFFLTFCPAPSPRDSMFLAMHGVKQMLALAGPMEPQWGGDERWRQEAPRMPAL